MRNIRPQIITSTEKITEIIHFSFEVTHSQNFHKLKQVNEGGRDHFSLSDYELHPIDLQERDFKSKN